MAEASKSQVLPRTMHWTTGDQQVEVVRTGHFPTTAIVRLSDGREIEVEMEALK